MIKCVELRLEIKQHSSLFMTDTFTRTEHINDKDIRNYFTNTKVPYTYFMIIDGRTFLTRLEFYFF